MKRLNKVMTIDPGWNTGIGKWLGNSLIPDTDIIIAPNVDNALQKMYYSTNKFGEHLRRFKPRLVMLEGTSFWADSLKSRASFSRGDAINLTYLIGNYIRECHSQNIKVQVILAQDWKGQMTDEMVKRRVDRRIAMDYKKIYGGFWPHVTDAVGIGLWMIGVF